MHRTFRYSLLPALVLLAGAAIRAQADAGVQPAGGVTSKAVVDSSKLVNVDANGREKIVESPAVIVRRGYLGIELTELTPELRTHFGAPHDAGVMVARVVPDSPADKAGLKVGDIITTLDGKPVASSWDVRARVRPMEEGALLPLEVRRDGAARTLTATVIQRERREVDYAPFLMKNGDTDRIMASRLHGSPGVNGPNAGAGIGAGVASPREEALERKLKALEKRLNDIESRLPKN